jgi:general secretion pathway protein I
MRPVKTGAERGFTLVEVMVALMVIAIALPALLKALYQQIDGTAYLRDKSIAQWVATNKLAENRIQLARNDVLYRGERNGITRMADRDWFWWSVSEPTEVEDFYRLEVIVAASEESRDQPLYTVVGFLHARTVTTSGR